MSIPIRWQLKKAVCDAYEAKNHGSSSLHGHCHFLLTLITRGEGVQTLNGRDIPFGIGDMFLLSPADFHKNTISPGQSYDYYGVKFPHGLIDGAILKLIALDKLPLHLHLSGNDFATASEIFKRLIEESNSIGERIAKSIYLKNMIEELIIIAIRKYAAKNGTQPSEFANRALGYLYSHFLENITVADAASFVGYTPNYFNTKFREAFSVPFGEYLLDLRLGYAEALLASSKSSITEIALESGFGTPAHFSRSFSKKYGVCPRDYRRAQSADQADSVTH